MVPVVSAPDELQRQDDSGQDQRPLPFASPKRRKLSQRTPAQAQMAKGKGNEVLTMTNRAEDLELNLAVG
ncbi:hypothetical protein BCON_0144g00010 [Botryotinia convoluta]|uniref:Uncharacterized protein n=1 Tax=Botryotinia convoluta TaxID=54673 RepID=A0A4Z1HU54_9HELO|nr:hypothetical protein BCON_0144g00010 [Botryotinia convoluta]